MSVWHIRENSIEFHISTCAESKARELCKCGDVELHWAFHISTSVDLNAGKLRIIGLPKFIYKSLLYHTTQKVCRCETIVDKFVFTLLQNYATLYYPILCYIALVLD